MAYLGRNTDCIMIFDDLDGLGDLRVIQQSLPRQSDRFVFSSRDPILCDTPELKATPIEVQRLMPEESRILLRREIGPEIAAADEELYRIAAISCYHPAMMLALVHYMRHILRRIYPANSIVGKLVRFLDEYNWQIRRAVFRQEIPGSLSLLGLYERPLERLKPEVRTDVSSLMDVVAFVSAPIGSSTRTSFHDFFRERPWLDSRMEDVDFPNRELLATPFLEHATTLSELERVSLLDRSPLSVNPSDIHPIWLECARHRCEVPMRKVWLRQLLLICFLDSTKDKYEETSNLFLENILMHSV
ncbi:uncharacterized protein F4822DRAFT_278876 [Hypoxylon trugodes]|uniref:uncharacterized protein n=1 Tax=Hypoxylon trugodes TaxID=326681 RepID=UPI0021958281|nr:uncharacterized protein F4822DRAFT_278876 [Hypoxylon trugodes]KAI1387295.1 hypothetical protein F4822DRAFT_278876 [Hypoxylon trugodes]